MTFRWNNQTHDIDLGERARIGAGFAMVAAFALAFVVVLGYFADFMY